MRRDRSIIRHRVLSTSFNRQIRFPSKVFRVPMTARPGVRPLDDSSASALFAGAPEAHDRSRPPAPPPAVPAASNTLRAISAGNTARSVEYSLNLSFPPWWLSFLRSRRTPLVVPSLSAASLCHSSSWYVSCRLRGSKPEPFSFFIYLLSRSLLQSSLSMCAMRTGARVTVRRAKLLTTRCPPPIYLLYVSALAVWPACVPLTVGWIGWQEPQDVCAAGVGSGCAPIDEKPLR